MGSGCGTFETAFILPRLDDSAEVVETADLVEGLIVPQFFGDEEDARGFFGDQLFGLGDEQAVLLVRRWGWLGKRRRRSPTFGR